MKDIKDNGSRINFDKSHQYLMSTTASQLVVRNPKDIPIIKNLAEYLTYLNTAILNISSTEMLKEVNMVKDIYNRLINVDLIKYDQDEFGNPLLSRRERKLLFDIIKLNLKKDKQTIK